MALFKVWKYKILSTLSCCKQLWQFLANLFNFLKICWIFFLKQGVYDKIFFQDVFHKMANFITKRITKYTLRQRTWDKVRCYWEHVNEHIKNWRNMSGKHIGNLGNMLKTWWENNGFNKNPKRATNVLPKEDFANSNYNIPLVLPMKLFFMPHVTISCESHKESRVKRGINVSGLCPLLWQERSSKLNNILKLSAP